MFFPTSNPSTKIKTAITSSVVVAVLITSLLSMQVAPAFAGGKHSPDFRITAASVSGGVLTMTVEGTAGGTTPTEASDVYAYVWILTDGEVYAVTSHEAEDFGDPDDNSDDIAWHGHEDVGVDENGCLTGEEDSAADAVTLNDNTVTLTSTTVAPEVDTALTAVLSINDEGSICIKHVFSAFNPQAT